MASTDGNAPIRLAAELGIDQAVALKAELLAQLDDEAPVRIDAAAVRRVHAASLQLLCLYCRERRAAGRSVEFLQASDSLRQSAALFGATHLLSLA